MLSLKKYLSILLSLLTVAGAFWYVEGLKTSSVVEAQKVENIGSFSAQRGCARHPIFLQKLKIPQPVAIDLSQKQYKGVAFLYGQNLSGVLHPKRWEKFDHFSTYALDPKGNMYLTPMPFISVTEHTFEFQKNIYRLDGNSGALTVWMSLDKVKPSPSNPFGVIAVDYDCDDNSLWVSTIDETDYHHNRGVLYHIDVASKKILQEVKGIEGLSIKLLRTQKGKYLLVGDARKNELYALAIESTVLSAKPIHLLTLPDANEHVRKIKIRGQNRLELQTIPFSYTLIAETSTTGDRKKYDASFNPSSLKWELLTK